jgi:hypothetical protein
MQCLFEFNNANEAEAMLGAVLPNMTFTKAEAFFWVVKSIDSNHVGHSCQLPLRAWTILKQVGLCARAVACAMFAFDT